MQSEKMSGPGAAESAPEPEQELMLFSEQTLRLVSVARTLVGQNRHVDLTGLQDQVGLLCAKALDLPPGRSALMAIELRRVLDEIGSLHDAMRENAA